MWFRALFICLLVLLVLRFVGCVGLFCCCFEFLFCFLVDGVACVCWFAGIVLGLIVLFCFWIVFGMFVMCYVWCAY